MSRPLHKRTGFDVKKTSEDVLGKVRRAWGSLMLMGLNLFCALAVVLVGGLQVFPRLLLSLAAALIVMSILFVVKIQWVAAGRGRGWVLLILGGAVFVVVAKVPFLPFKPMSLIDMIQAPLSANFVLVLLLVLCAFFCAVGHLYLKARR